MERQELGPLAYEVDGAVAHIVLDDPRRANSQTSEMVHAFDDALTLADRDYYGEGGRSSRPTARASAPATPPAVGTSTPSSPRTWSDWDSVWKAQADLFLWPTLRLWEFRKPTIAQVHGYALGGGTYWALLPDITVASDDAYFQMPLVQGLGFPGGETMIEPWVFMNWKRTFEYLYTAQTLTADEALDMGLVNRVVPRAELDATVDELAAHDRARPVVDAHGHEAAGDARVGADGHAHAPADVDRRDGGHRPHEATRKRCARRWWSEGCGPGSTRPATTTS